MTPPLDSPRRLALLRAASQEWTPHPVLVASALARVPDAPSPAPG